MTSRYAMGRLCRWEVDRTGLWSCAVVALRTPNDSVFRLGVSDLSRKHSAVAHPVNSCFVSLHYIKADCMKSWVATPSPRTCSVRFTFVYETPCNWCRLCWQLQLSVLQTHSLYTDTEFTVISEVSGWFVTWAFRQICLIQSWPIRRNITLRNWLLKAADT
jgi:hypothetical protein